MNKNQEFTLVTETFIKSVYPVLLDSEFGHNFGTIQGLLEMVLKTGVETKILKDVLNYLEAIGLIICKSKETRLDGKVVEQEHVYLIDANEQDLLINRYANITKLYNLEDETLYSYCMGAKDILIRFVKK